MSIMVNLFFLVTYLFLFLSTSFKSYGGTGIYSTRSLFISFCIYSRKSLLFYSVLISILFYSYFIVVGLGKNLILDFSVYDWGRVPLAVLLCSRLLNSLFLMRFLTWFADRPGKFLAICSQLLPSLMKHFLSIWSSSAVHGLSDNFGSKWFLNNNNNIKIWCVTYQLFVSYMSINFA